MALTAASETNPPTDHDTDLGADTAGGSDGVQRSRVVRWRDPHEIADEIAGRSGLEFIKAMASGELRPPPIMATIGAWLEHAEPGRVVFCLDPAEYHYNPIGTVHGGIVATLLDSAAGCAVHTMLDQGVGYTSVDLNVKFLGAMRMDTGRVTCTGTVTHLGRRTALAEARLHTAAGKLLATATSTCLILT